jgi:hypothetical protein
MVVENLLNDLSDLVEKMDCEKISWKGDCGSINILSEVEEIFKKNGLRVRDLDLTIFDKKPLLFGLSKLLVYGVFVPGLSSESFNDTENKGTIVLAVIIPFNDVFLIPVCRDGCSDEIEKILEKEFGVTMVPIIKDNVDEELSSRINNMSVAPPRNYFM